MGKQTASAPDFKGAAQQQSQSSRPNTQNAVGGQSWSIGPDGREVSTNQFSGAANDAFQGLLGGMNSAAGMDPAAAGQAASDKMYGVLKGRLDPQWQQNQGMFDAKMANSGIDAGSDAYGNASRNFGQQQNDAYSQASGQAIGLGQAEQQQARANAMQPFLQGNSMMSMLNQQGNMGQAAQYSQAARDQYGANKDTASQNNAKKGGALSGLGNIAGMAFGVPGLGKAAGGLLGGGGYDENLGGYNF
jgi:hypothetical protein